MFLMVQVVLKKAEFPLKMINWVNLQRSADILPFCAREVLYNLVIWKINAHTLLGLKKVHSWNITCPEELLSTLKLDS